MENPKVFFSYSRADREFVLELATDLRKAGVDLWIDQLDIAAGDRWDRAVEDALAAAPCLLVVLSPASVESHNVMDEVSLAFDERKKIVPVLARECTIPFRLRRLQHIDFTVDYDKGLEGLLKPLSLQPPPGVGTGRVGSERAAALSAPRQEPARSTSELSSTGAVLHKYIYGAIAAAILAATAGAVSFYLIPRNIDSAKGPEAPTGEPETTASAPARKDKDPVANSPAPDTGPTANVAAGPLAAPSGKLAPGSDAGPSAALPPGPDERDATYSPQPQDSRPKALSVSPPPLPAPEKPVDGTFDVTMSCRNGSQVNEYGAQFTGGTYARTYQTENGAINTQLALGYINKSTVKLTGSVAFEEYGVQAVDASGRKKGNSYVGLGKYGPSTNCKLTIIDKN